MNTLMHFIDSLGLQLDYGWFLALLAWSAVIVGLTREHWGAARPWLIGFAAANLLMPLLELFSFVSWQGMGNMSTNYSPARWLLGQSWDLAIGALPPLATMFLAMAGLSGSAWYIRAPRPVRSGIFGAALLLAVGLGELRIEWPISVGLAVGVITAGVVGWMIARRRPRDGYWTAGLAWWALLAWGATTGPLAYALGEDRRYYEMTAFALPAQIISLGAAVMLAVAVWRQRLESAADGAAWTGARKALWVLAAWCAAGFIFLQWSGRAARNDYETGLLRRAQLIASYLAPADLEAALGPRFQLGEIQTRLRPPTDDPLTYSRVPYAATPPFGRLREQLKPAIQANDDFWDASLMTVRDRWFAVAVKWPDYPHYYTEIIVYPPPAHLPVKINQVDRGIIQPPTREPWGYMMHALVPLARPDGGILGWLDIEVDGADWAAALNLARLQTMGVLLAGVLLWATGIGLWLGRARQARAQGLAAAAAASDRAKGILLANVSHELRTPLQSIMGYCALLQADVEHERGRARLAALRLQGKVMTRVVNDLLDLSAIESGSFQFAEDTADLRHIVHTVTESFRPRAAAKKLELAFVPDPALPVWVKTDANRIHQIAANLVSNAVKFTACGRVDVTLGVVAATVDGWVIALVVADTGPGIRPEDHEKLFKPFSRLDPASAHEGSGLGLALSAALCQKAGGRLGVESDRGNGAQFRAEFSVRRAEARTEAGGEIAPRLQGRRILVAEDNPLVRDLFLSYLADCGVACDQAVNGRQALELARAGSYDAILMDLSMPELDGFAVTAALRADDRIRPNLLIVGVSAHAGLAEQKRALEVGMNAFLVKPVELSDLAVALAIPEDRTGREAELRQREALTGVFRKEAAAQAEAVLQQLRAADWILVRERAHYLKCSAAVVRDDALYTACAALEDAAMAGQPGKIWKAWWACVRELEPWLDRPAWVRLDESMPQ